MDLELLLDDISLTTFYLFASSYVIVFLLGLQSQVVRDKQVFSSFVIATGIGCCELFKLKLAPEASVIDGSFFVLGGSLGIVSSIYFHTKFFTKRWFYLKNNYNRYIK